MQKINFWNSFNLFSRKVIFLLLLFGIGINNIFSQEKVLQNIPLVDNKKIIFGFGLGLVTTNFKIIPSENGTLGYFNNKNGGMNLAYSNNTVGFYASGFMNIWIIDDFLSYQLEAGGWVGSLSMHYRQEEKVFSDFFGREFRDKDNFREANMYIFYFPSYIRLSPIRINNYKPFLMAGISYMYNIGSNEDFHDDNKDGVFRIKSNMLNWELCVGTDIYMPFFKLSTVIKGIFGINNILVKDNTITPWTDPIDNMFFRSVTFSLIFSGSK